MGHCTLHQHFSAIEKELDLLKKTTKGEFSSSLFTDLQTEVKIQGEELHKEVKMATEAIEDSTKTYIGEINLQITGLKQQVADLS
uniref:Cerebellar degeneration-related protein 2-like n=1 Tax=Bursaphelenchus xylophilus TaxID=6326 RepID=A0A1I7SFJ4_BURXY